MGTELYRAQGACCTENWVLYRRSGIELCIVRPRFLNVVYCVLLPLGWKEVNCYSKTRSYYRICSVLQWYVPSMYNTTYCTYTVYNVLHTLGFHYVLYAFVCTVLMYAQ